MKMKSRQIRITGSGENFLLDATWDSLDERICYFWFLKGSDGFDLHTPKTAYEELAGECVWILYDCQVKIIGASIVVGVNLILKYFAKIKDVTFLDGSRLVMRFTRETCLFKHLLTALALMFT